MALNMRECVGAIQCKRRRALGKPRSRLAAKFALEHGFDGLRGQQPRSLGLERNGVGECKRQIHVDGPRCCKVMAYNQGIARTDKNINRHVRRVGGWNALLCCDSGCQNRAHLPIMFNPMGLAMPDPGITG